MGLTQKEQEDLFKPFSQADGSTTREYGGTGLGLVISKELIEMLNGCIWLESEINKGSCFYFEIEYEKCTKKEIESEESNLFAISQKINLVENSDVLLEDDKKNSTILDALIKEYIEALKTKRPKFCETIYNKIKEFSLSYENEELFKHVKILQDNYEFETIIKLLEDEYFGKKS